MKNKSIKIIIFLIIIFSLSTFLFKNIVSSDNLSNPKASESIDLDNEISKIQNLLDRDNIRINNYFLDTLSRKNPVFVIVLEFDSFDILYNKNLEYISKNIALAMDKNLDSVSIVWNFELDDQIVELGNIDYKLAGRNIRSIENNLKLIN